ncbi:CgeB family protein [Pontibacter beigongshangensis]|uniref:hypothetical protein n=1 Tax=Pontibacter beigongshangensis TaxID=2574733 RepID=UPI001650BA71|nr:hypothetical protein [Pontibacter beigongshangensis]
MIERVKNMLAGKKVLFIACKFYHYGDAIHEKFRSYGADVTFYYERDTSLKHVVMSNFFPDKMQAWQDRHYQKILQETEGKRFDYLIVIRGFRMENWFVDTIRKRNPGIYTILYQWDSYKAWESDFRHLLPSFDKTLTFDYDDCKTLALPYAPTFYTDEYAGIKNGPYEFDFIYCTNLSLEKYEFMIKFLAYASQRGYRVRTHLYISWLGYVLNRMKGYDIDYQHVSFRRLSRKEYFKLFCKSKTIVDFSGTSQTGITMRIIDALGSGKRVITNNVHVTKEPGYDPRQVVVYNANDIDLPDDITQEESFSKKDYSIDKWMDNLFFKTLEPAFA